MNNVFFYQTDIGKIGIADNGTSITNLYFGEAIPPNAVLGETELIKEASTQLYDYLSGKRKVFELPMNMEGTSFQHMVWDALKAIPYGETRSYKEIAESIGRPTAARAVGMANNKNRIPVFVPCHRVIGANGKLIGYAGGLDIKIKLLNIEKPR